MTLKAVIPFLRKTFLHLRNAWFLAAVVSSLFPFLIAWACRIDGTLLVNGGVGLFQHYGYLAMFFTTPIIVFVTSSLVNEFSAAIRKTDQYCIDRSRRAVDRLVHRHLKRLSLRAQRSWVPALIVSFFLIFWIVNVVNTVSFAAAHGNYGHVNGIFDSDPLSQPYGFYAAKIYLLFVFGLVYSSAMVVVFRVTFSMICIFRSMYRHDILLIDLFNPDNCGGTSRFGAINLKILYVYMFFSIVTFSMSVTHPRLSLPLRVLLPVDILLALVQSFVPVHYISSAVAKKKCTFLNVVTTQLNTELASLVNNKRFSSDLLALRNYLINIRNLPYSARTVPLYYLSFISPALAFVGFVRRVW